MEMFQVWQICGGSLPFFPGQLSGLWASGHEFGIPAYLESVAALENLILGLMTEWYSKKSPWNIVQYVKHFIFPPFLIVVL